ncbi:diphthamide synthesis protein [Candidatus Woesearchaeota archaeon]|nr:diphthamide synthesis protein [Candidatus Woesearchaeota archaeon]
MKLLFIPAKSKEDITPVLKKVKIKGKIGLIASVQYLDQLEKAKKYFKNSVICGQVLGCNTGDAEKKKDMIDAYLFIGSGRFHPLDIFRKTGKPTYMANPATNEFSQLTAKEFVNFEKQKKGRLLKFLNAEKVGILVSSKPHQYNLQTAYRIKEHFKDKECLIFLCNNIRQEDLENFPEVEIWVNTACPRIEGKNIINASDLPKQHE